MEKFLLPHGVEDCRRRLWDAGWPTYPVGGCVRDLLLGRVPGDYDMTTAALPEQVMALFPRTIPTGLKHGTVTVLTPDGPVEVTTFRREGGYGDGRHPDEVTFDATLEEDLSRRDFTINAMALGLEGEIIDPFHGREDLAGKLIRCVGKAEQRFAEDALRMFRAGRFAAQLNFALEGDTLAAIRTCAPLAAQVSAERVRVEVEKTICSPRPGWVAFLIETGLLARYVESATGPFPPLAGLPAEALPRWAGLCAALGRAPEPFLKALRLERRTIKACTTGYTLWKKGLPTDAGGWRRVLAEHGVAGVCASAWMGDWAGECSSTLLEEVLAGGDCWSVKNLALSGAELAALGYHGTEIGAAQKYLLEYVLTFPQENTREKLLAHLNKNRGLQTQGGAH